MVRITRKAFYELGGFANSKLFRMCRNDGAWSYWQLVD